MVKKTYQVLQSELNDVVSKLENPEVDIDEATAAYEQGLKLVKQIELRLTEAENRIIKAQTDFTSSSEAAV